MELQLVAIYDKRAQEYSPPQAYVTLAVAERSFSDAVQNKESQLNRHPEDFSMQHLGNYNSETGIIYMKKEGPEHLFDATQFIPQ